MSKVYQDDEWKWAEEEPVKRTGIPSPTRAEMQARVDTYYGQGRIELEEWRRRTNELSDVEKWDQHGRIK